jgi:Icc-related predicted phosphoesterase
VNHDLRCVLAVANPRGQAERLEGLLAQRETLGFDSVAVVGDLAGEDGYRPLFEALGRAGIPAFWVPGPSDAPVQDYLREAHNMEIVFPLIRGVHGTVAVARHQVIAGIGGEVVDEPGAERDEVDRLRYPGWEAEYRLKALSDLEDKQTILLFATPPAHKGLHKPGSEVLAELVSTYRARLVITGEAEPGARQLGKTTVVSPGDLASGDGMLIDLHAKTAAARTLAAS